MTSWADQGGLHHRPCGSRHRDGPVSKDPLAAPASRHGTFAGGEAGRTGAVHTRRLPPVTAGMHTTPLDVAAPGCARVLMSARSRSSHVLAVSSSFKHILYSSPAGAFTEYITRAPIG